MAESEELKSLLMKVKEESEKVGYFVDFIQCIWLPYASVVARRALVASCRVIAAARAPRSCRGSAFTEHQARGTLVP